MFDSAFAQRLLKWSTLALTFSIFILLLGILLGYVLDPRLSMGWQMVGHYLIGAGALGIKLNYIARLAALDVLQPHPEGWVAELGLCGPRLIAPAALTRDLSVSRRSA